MRRTPFILTMDIQLQDNKKQYSLRWKNYERNLLSVFDQLLHQEALVDVTLATEGKSLRCHKVVLSACSSYFKAILSDTDQTQHPIVILRDVTWSELKYIVEYMYKGEINVSQEELPAIFKLAESLEVSGLNDFEKKGSDSGVTIINATCTKVSNNGRSQSPVEDIRQQRKRHISQYDGKSQTSEAGLLSSRKPKLASNHSSHDSSTSPSSVGSVASGPKKTSFHFNHEHQDVRDSGSECGTPQPPSLVQHPPPPPTNSPQLPASLESHPIPPKLKEHRPSSYQQSTTPLPYPPSIPSPSTSGLISHPMNNLNPSLSLLQNQHQKLFPSFPSTHNSAGLMGPSSSKKSHFDDMSDVKPSILEMIQEERRVS